jgi:hypothetical protein
MSHRRAALYLQIPAAYCRAFGGLRWAQYGDAVEFLDGPDAGRTFAFAAEIGQFLEGLLVPGGACPAFGTALHLLHMLGLGDRASNGGPAGFFRNERLARPFRELGSPLRSAGALCARLDRDVPGVADPPGLAEVLQLLNGGSWIPQMVLSHPMLGAMDYAEQPAVNPPELDACVRARLEELSDEAIRHWLKFGRGPLAEADAVRIALPEHGLAGALERLEERPRLAGLSRLVSRLEGALSLPPRRLDHDGPQVDGYWDLTTRGSPEQILPIQFALEDEEFLRRFAERELLYYHRETPSRPVSHELVLLLDQGVRPWGDVRLVLAGAAMALARQAARRRLVVRLAVTGDAGELVDPAGMGAEALGELLEGSDLTPNPARALARVLRGDSAMPRDVALLTHPRSLAEPAVVDAARRPAEGGGTRLFAVAVDPGGEVELAELRRGRPVTLGHCRVDLADATDPGRPDAARAPAAHRAAWRGDIEPIPFPFRCGLLVSGRRDADLDGRLIDFDGAGDRIAVVLRHGQIGTFQVDGIDSEILPRPAVDGEVLRSVAAVIGVAGGFVVLGRRRDEPILAHYDFATRTCRVHEAPDWPGEAEDPSSWFYYPDLHSIAWRPSQGRRPSVAIDLSQGEHASASPRARHAAERLRAQSLPYPLPATQFEAHTGRPPAEHAPQAVELDARTGTLTYIQESGEPRSVVPLADGLPALKAARIASVQRGGDVLAVQVETASGRDLDFISMARSTVIGSYSCGAVVEAKGWFALSRDGQRFARRFGQDQVEVREVPGDRPPLLVTPRETLWVHFASLGRSCLLVRELDQFGARRPHAHALIRWDAGRLEVDHADPVQAFHQLGGVVAESRALPSERMPARCDAARFVQIIVHGALKVLIDHYNHLAVLGGEDRLVAMFFMAGREFAAWMPDGTRLGASRLIGGEPTPGAADRIAAALRAAERGEGGGR